MRELLCIKWYYRDQDSKDSGPRAPRAAVRNEKQQPPANKARGGDEYH
jgi:hypothetical protein